MTFPTIPRAVVASHSPTTAARRGEWQGKDSHATQQGQAREQWTMGETWFWSKIESNE